MTPSLDCERPDLTVNELVRARSRALTQVGEPQQARPSAPEGRLLAYFPDEQLADGTAEYVTHGFFDTEDTPPWDTWVALRSDASRREFLVSWVPTSFVDLVQEGVAVNPVECIRWLAEVDALLNRQLLSSVVT